MSVTATEVMLSKIRSMGLLVPLASAFAIVVVERRLHVPVRGAVPLFLVAMTLMPFATGLDVVWPQLLAQAGIGAALFWLALRRFRALVA